MLEQSRKIFFVGSVDNPYSNSLLGGQKVTISHVRTLRQWGFSAFVVTAMWRIEAFRLRKHSDPIFITQSEFAKIINRERDVVVLPGRFLPELDKYPGNNKILFSQGAYITFGAISATPRCADYWDNPSIKAIFCVSEGNAELFRLVAKRCPTLVIPNYVAAPPEHKALKRPLVVFPPLNRPEKNPLDTKVVLNLISAKLKSINYPLYSQLEYVELSGLSYQQVQEVLAAASVMLFLGNNEGLPLTVLEAMGHGVITLAFNRRALSDILPSSCLFEINELERISDAAITILEKKETWAPIKKSMNDAIKIYNEQLHLDALRTAWSRVEIELQKTT